MPAGARGLVSARVGRAAAAGLCALGVLAALEISGSGPAGAQTLAAVETPFPAGLRSAETAGGNPYIDINSVSCITSAWCVAVGDGEAEIDSEAIDVPIVLTLSSGAWSAATAPLPSDGSDGVAFLQSVSCSSVDECAAVGTDGAGNAIAETLSGSSTWNPAVLAMPADAFSPAEPEMWGVDCPADGSCVAVGGYKVAGNYYEGLAATLSGTAWSTAVEIDTPGESAPNPATDSGPENDSWLTAVSCPSSTDCVAVGKYQGLVGEYTSDFGWSSVLSAGGWAAGSELPVPAAAYAPSPDTDPDGIACPASGTCVAVGSDDSSSTSYATYTATMYTLSPASGWTAGQASLPDGSGGVPAAGAGTQSGLAAVTCTGSGSVSCVAVGNYQQGAPYYPEFPLTEAFGEQGGSWGTASPGTTPVPANAGHVDYSDQEPISAGAGLLGVSCPAGGQCLEVGHYNDDNGSFNENPLGCQNGMAVGVAQDAPLDAQATPGPQSVTVSWQAPGDDGGPPIAGYDVYDGTATGEEGSTPVNGSLIPAGTLSYDVGGLTDGTTYYFTVETVNAVGSSPPSSEASATPGTVVTTSSSTSSTSTSSTTTTSTTTTSTSTTSTSTTSTTSTSTSTTSTSLPATTTTGASSGPSGATRPVPAPQGSTPVPLAPLGLVATGGDGEVALAWQPPSGGPTVTGYEVYDGTSPGAEFSMPTGPALPAASTTDTVSGLLNGTTYYFVVQALGAGGSSAFSNEVAAVPTSTASTSPLADGTVFVTDFSGRVIEIAPGGSEQSLGSGLDLPSGLAVDAAGNLYIADEGNNRIVRLALEPAPPAASSAGTPTSTTLPGSGATGAVQSVVGHNLFDPAGVAVDSSGDVFVADTWNDDAIEYPAGNKPPRTIDGHGLLGTGRTLEGPGGIAVNATGQAYIADTGDGTVVRINLADDLVSTVASDLEAPAGIAVDAAGNLWIAEMGTGVPGSGRLDELDASDGHLVTVLSGLDAPDAVAIDSAGTVFVADENGVFEVDAASGSKRSIGTGLDRPVGLAVYPPAALTPQAAP